MGLSQWCRIYGSRIIQNFTLSIYLLPFCILRSSPGRGCHLGEKTLAQHERTASTDVPPDGWLSHFGVPLTHLTGLLRTRISGLCPRASWCSRSQEGPNRCPFWQVPRRCCSWAWCPVWEVCSKALLRRHGAVWVGGFQLVPVPVLVPSLFCRTPASHGAEQPKPRASCCCRKSGVTARPCCVLHPRCVYCVINAFLLSWDFIVMFINAVNSSEEGMERTWKKMCLENLLKAFHLTGFHLPCPGETGAVWWGICACSSRGRGRWRTGRCTHLGKWEQKDTALRY